MRNIEIKERSKVKDIFQVLGNKAEDIYLSLVLLLPERMIPGQMMERYIYKRKTELEAQQIKIAWRMVDLEVAKNVIENPKK